MQVFFLIAGMLAFSVSFEVGSENVNSASKHLARRHKIFENKGKEKYAKNVESFPSTVSDSSQSIATTPAQQEGEASPDRESAESLSQVYSDHALYWEKLTMHVTGESSEEESSSSEEDAYICVR
eukprot:Platyproteum_vivax@DN7614_c0_g7_i1.p1